MTATPPKYSLFEHERRWLVGAPPPIDSLPFRLIEDLYLEGRLRLRRITASDTGAQEFKLCKKYEWGDCVSAPITNLYLDVAEYSALAALPGRTISKRRYGIAHNGHRYSMDVFDGALAGLALCEIEARSADDIATIPAPPWSVREVTRDPAFSGWALSQLAAAAATAFMASHAR